MTARALTTAWLGLIALSVVAAVLTKALAMQIAGPLILMLALLKARIILINYLDLKHTPAWGRGFTMVIGLFQATVLVLYLATVW